jgi:hypothetical protein
MMSMLDEVNPLDVRLSSEEALALYRMIQKREQYVGQGRSREAHGLGTGIHIMWRTLTGEVPKSTMLGDI